jgi:hypothetical protein
VVVQHADEQGARLEAGFDGEFSLCVPAKGFADDQTLASTPAVVRAVIQRALALGWRPRQRGPAMRLQSQERFHPGASRPLVGDRGYDPAKLDEYLAGATLLPDERHESIPHVLLVLGVALHLVGQNALLANDTEGQDERHRQREPEADRRAEYERRAHEHHHRAASSGIATIHAAKLPTSA